MRWALVSNKNYSFGDAVTSRTIGSTCVERVLVVQAATDCIAFYDLDAHRSPDAALSKESVLMCLSGL
jgi:hypothetical protein